MVKVMVSEDKTLASDGMEVCSGKDGGRECRGARVQGRMRQGKKDKK